MQCALGGRLGFGIGYYVAKSQQGASGSRAWGRGRLILTRVAHSVSRSVSSVGLPIAPPTICQHIGIHHSGLLFGVPGKGAGGCPFLGLQVHQLNRGNLEGWPA